MRVFVCCMYIMRIQRCKRLCEWAVVFLVLLSCVCTCMCLYVVCRSYVYEHPRRETYVLPSTLFSWGVYVCVCMCMYVYVSVCMCMYVYVRVSCMHIISVWIFRRQCVWVGHRGRLHGPRRVCMYIYVFVRRMYMMCM